MTREPWIQSKSFGQTSRGSLHSAPRLQAHVRLGLRPQRRDRQLYRSISPIRDQRDVQMLLLEMIQAYIKFRTGMRIPEVEVSVEEEPEVMMGVRVRV